MCGHGRASGWRLWTKTTVEALIEIIKDPCMGSSYPKMAPPKIVLARALAADAHEEVRCEATLSRALSLSARARA